MKQYDDVALVCQVAPGAFSTERSFHVALSGGGEYVGLGDEQYFFDREGRPLTLAQIEQAGQLPGLVSAWVVAVDGEDTCRVSVPSGEVLSVARSVVRPHPKQEPAHVPVES